MDRKDKRIRPMDYALRVLSRRRVTKAQLEESLKRKGAPDEEIQSCLERLSSWGYLDDRSYARDMLAESLSGCPVARRRAVYDLVKRGISKSLAEEAADEAYGDRSEGDLAQVAAEKYLSGRQCDSLTDQERERLARWLWRRGFDGEAIRSVLRERNPGVLM